MDLQRRPEAVPEVMNASVAALLSVVESWNSSEISYAIANGIESFPCELGRDVDVVVKPSHAKQAVQLALATLADRGWHVQVRHVAELYQCIAFHHESGDSLVIDILCGLRWRATQLVDHPRAVVWNGPFKIDIWSQFVKRVLLHVLTDPSRKFAAYPERLILSESEHQTLSPLLEQHFGREAAAMLVDALEAKDVNTLRTLTPRLRRELMLRSFRHQPMNVLRTAFRWVRARLAIATAKPVLPIVSVVGPDGVGKSSVLCEVQKQARTRLRCTRAEVRHWRPGLLPPLGSLLGKSVAVEEGGVPPRRTAGRFALIRLIYYGCDFVLGALKDRRTSADLGLVLYDRCSLDMYVDPLRFGLKSTCGVRKLLSVVPRPNFVILLYDDPRNIYSRKAELSEEEIGRQLRAWLSLAEHGEVHVVLPITGRPSETAKEILDHIQSYWIQRWFVPPAGVPSSSV